MTMGFSLHDNIDRIFKYAICLQENTSQRAQLFLMCFFWGVHICCFAFLVIFFYLVRVYLIFFFFRLSMGYFSALGIRLTETMSQVFLPSPVQGEVTCPSSAICSSLPRVRILSEGAEQREPAGSEAS